MIVGIHHVGLTGPDPVRALAASGRFMDAPVMSAGDGATMAGPNLYLHARMGGAAAPAPVHAPGLAHLCVQARAPAPARERLEGAGVQLVAEPRGLGTGFHYAYARDVDGRLMELETAPFLPEAPQGWFAHVAFVTHDLARLATFYGALVGRPLTPGGRLPKSAALDHVAGLDGVDVEATWIRGLNIGLEFWRYHAPSPPAGARQSGYAHVAFETTDAGAAADRTVSLGATPDFDAPTVFGARHIRAVRDPDGNRIVFVQFDDGATCALGALAHPDLVDRVLAARG